MFSGQTQPAPWAEKMREYTGILQTQEYRNMALILLIYSKLSMNECNQAICIACYWYQKSFGNTFRWCDMFLLYFHSENANKHGAPHLSSRQNMAKLIGALEQDDYSWIQMIWNGSQVLLQMTSRWAPSHSSTPLRHEHAWTVHPGKEIAWK